MKGQMLNPQLWVPFDIRNIDLANQNFGEPTSETNSFARFNEYLTRFVNKWITGNPEWLDTNGQLIGFSLDDAIRNPNSQTKTHSEVMALMKKWGLWSEATGFNKMKAIENLKKPV